MNTTKLRTRSIGVTILTACVTALPVYAQDTASSTQQSTPKPAASKQQNIGVASGLMVGAVAGGPIGAIIGAAAGGWLGDRYHKQATQSTALAANLDKSESDRTRLAHNVTELNGTLAHEQEHGEQLDLALSHTDEVETDVGFRTDDDTVQTQAMTPLTKLGALAAAMPDAKVRVAGYADPRGSKSWNQALSKRRADAVAEVLENAGVPKDRLIVEAYGKSAATSDEGDMDGYAFDRRVTVRIERSGQTGDDAVARNDAK
jgi:outer membrane protein OmpA-like peptidoglycan-associated protein